MHYLLVFIIVVFIDDESSSDELDSEDEIESEFMRYFHDDVFMHNHVESLKEQFFDLFV